MEAGASYVFGLAVDPEIARIEYNPGGVTRVIDRAG